MEGDTVLVHAAASGVGTTLIQLCKAFKARTIAVASTAEKLQRCQELGAFASINYKETPNFNEQVLQFTDKKGASLILDPVGAQNF